MNAKHKAIKDEISLAKSKGYGFYCYALIDPRNEQIFYIGKGKNNRVFNHELNVRRGIVENASKSLLIQEILSDKTDIEIRILAFSQASFDGINAERFQIRLNKPTLTNIQHAGRDLIKEIQATGELRLREMEYYVPKNRKDSHIIFRFLQRTYSEMATDTIGYLTGKYDYRLVETMSRLESCYEC